MKSWGALGEGGRRGVVIAIPAHPPAHLHALCLPAVCWHRAEATWLPTARQKAWWHGGHLLQAKGR